MEAIRAFAVRVRRDEGTARIEALFVALAIVVALGSFERSIFFLDLKPIYCAGLALRHGMNPYTIGALHPCEAAPLGLPPVWSAGLTAPVPLPPYYLLVFAVLSFAPYPVVAVTWTIAGLAAFLAAIRLLATVARTPAAVVALALSIGGIWYFVQIEQPMPFMLLGLVASAALLEADRPRLAACAAALLLPQPQIGAAVLVALAIAEARARVPVAMIAFAVAAISAAIPSSTLYELRVELPLAARVHLDGDGNLALPAIAHQAGLGTALALHAGAVVAIVGAVVTIVLAGRCARRLSTPALTVLLVPAGLLASGVYVHFQQVVLALPAALVLASRLQGRARVAAAVAALALAVPWDAEDLYPPMSIPVVVVVLGLARGLGLSRRLSVPVFACVIVLLALEALGPGHRRLPIGTLARVHATEPALDAEENLAALQRLTPSTRPLVTVTFDLLTLTGLVVVVVSAAASGRRLSPRDAPA